MVRLLTQTKALSFKYTSSPHCSLHPQVSCFQFLSLEVKILLNHSRMYVFAMYLCWYW